MTYGSDIKILVVDDEKDMCDLLAHLMIREGFEPLTACDGSTALEMMRTHSPEVMLLDVKMPGMDGMEVMRQARAYEPDIPVVFITAYAEVKGAIDAMKAGAHDYIAKPFDHNEVVRVVQRALNERRLKRKIRNMSSHLLETHSLRKTMGRSEAVNRIISKVNRVAQSDFTVIIQGETGSGKELVARAVHHASHRSGGRFVAVDCGAIPETLLESELFGHEKGAFTGAIKKKHGKFESAKNGTLLLDEISNMTLGAQAKLLRALQEKTIFRVGGTEPFEIDVRVLVSCNQDLGTPATDGSFRKDLYYRLNDFTIRIPPLRKRREDIPFLAKRFLEMTNIELGKSVEGFSDSAMNVLMAYDWPGNVRQLRASVRRAVLMTDDLIREKDLDIRNTADTIREIGLRPDLSEKPWEKYSLKEIVQKNSSAVERIVLGQALQFTGGNKAKVARLLKIDYKTVHNKIKQLGL